MAYVGILEIVLAVIFFLFFHLWRKNHYRHHGNGLPKSFPLIGMMPELLINIHRIHDWCTELLERCQCTFMFNGSCFTNMNLLVTCDPENIHYVMSSKFSNFTKGSELKEILEILGDGIFNADMDLWKNQRKAAQEFMRNQFFYQFLVRTSKAKVQKGLIPVLDHVSKQKMVVNLEDVFGRFTFDSICILITGYDPKSLSIDFPEVVFSKALDDAEEAMFYRQIRPQAIVKLQRWLNIGQEKKYREAWEVLDNIVGKYVSQKRHELKEQKERVVSEKGVDLLTSYITEKISTTGLNCDDKFLRDTILNMLLAGRDTSSSSLTWLFWLISKHPKVENKIIEELESIIPLDEQTRPRGRRIFNSEDVKNLVYLHGAICEALRLYPPVPFQYKKPVKPDILPSGHVVNPDMKIVFNLYCMGRMKSIWGEDCFEFKPERWITERGGIKYEPSYKFLSFNAGPRSCIGKEVAFVQMKAVASAVIYNYRFHVLEEHLVSPATSIILHTKNGLMAKVTNRWE